ncbi:unnamed protein product [Amoebophrya sp. A25]|nr:unnamed protein product [Amoebophrya sp. A25]|eukprot:GSA25T00009788001.1
MAEDTRLIFVTSERNNNKEDLSFEYLALINKFRINPGLAEILQEAAPGRVWELVNKDNQSASTGDESRTIQVDGPPRNASYFPHEMLLSDVADIMLVGSIGFLDVLEKHELYTCNAVKDHKRALVVPMARFGVGLAERLWKNTMSIRDTYGLPNPLLESEWTSKSRDRALGDNAFTRTGVEKDKEEYVKKVLNVLEDATAELRK